MVTALNDSSVSLTCYATHVTIIHEISLSNSSFIQMESTEEANSQLSAEVEGLHKQLRRSGCHIYKDKLILFYTFCVFMVVALACQWIKN